MFLARAKSSSSRASASVPVSVPSMVIALTPNMAVAMEKLPPRSSRVDDLRMSGLSSLGLVNLMLSVETEFDLKIPKRDMTPANFRSVTRIATRHSHFRWVVPKPKVFKARVFAVAAKHLEITARRQRPEFDVSRAPDIPRMAGMPPRQASTDGPFPPRP